MPTAALPDIRTERALTQLCLALADPERLSNPERDLVGGLKPLPEDHPAVVEAARQFHAGGDPLGDLFTSIRSGEDRRELGQFYTPAPIVAAMNRWALDRSPNTIVDAGCGSGRYALDLRRQGFTGHLVAIDLDPLATLMVRAADTVLSLDIDIRCGSFLELTLDESAGKVAYVGNPPYVRHHQLPAGTKQWAKATAADMGVDVSGLAGLHALFFLAVAAKARPGDLCTFITASEWFDTRYGRLVRELLTGPLRASRIDAASPTATTFDDALTTAVITYAETAASNSRLTWRVVDDPALLATREGGEQLSVQGLRDLRQWSALTRDDDGQDRGGWVPLSRYLKVTRGPATGANKYFLMTVEEAEERGLTRYAHPCVSRSNELAKLSDAEVSADDVAKVIIDLPAELDGHPAAADYVADGEARGMDKGFLCRQRSPWWALRLPEPPPVFATYMARQPPRFVHNVGGVQHTNVVHGLRPQGGVSDEDVARIVAWLNGHRELLVGGRTYHGGLNKFEPRELADVLMPPLAEVREQDIWR